jgi:hypothetical protein
MVIGKQNLAKRPGHIIGFFLYSLKVVGNLTIFSLAAWGEPSVAQASSCGG